MQWIIGWWLAGVVLIGFTALYSRQTPMRSDFPPLILLTLLGPLCIIWAIAVVIMRHARDHE